MQSQTQSTGYGALHFPLSYWVIVCHDFWHQGLKDTHGHFTLWWSQMAENYFLNFEWHIFAIALKCYISTDNKLQSGHTRFGVLVQWSVAVPVWITCWLLYLGILNLFPQTFLPLLFCWCYFYACLFIFRNWPLRNFCHISVFLLQWTLWSCSIQQITRYLRQIEAIRG